MGATPYDPDDRPSTFRWSGAGEPDAWTWSDGIPGMAAQARPAECTLDLSAIPAPARPALAEALQAAVARLAEGGTGLDPTGPAGQAGDVVLRELFRRQMEGMLRYAAAAGGEGGE